jgi:hypothetical protein
VIPIIQNEPIVDQNDVQRQPLRPALKGAGSRSIGPYVVCSTWRHTEFPERSRLAHAHTVHTESAHTHTHTAASHRPVLSAEHWASERPVGGFWPRICDLRS